MDVGINEYTLAIITMDKNIVSANIPIFYVENKEQLEKKSLMISKCMQGMVHDIGDNTFIVVKH